MKKLKLKICCDFDKEGFSSLNLLPFWCGLVAGLIGAALSRLGILGF